MGDYTMHMPALPLTSDAVKVIAWCLSAREGRPASFSAADLMDALADSDRISEFISTLAYIGAVLSETCAEALSAATDQPITPDDILMAIVNHAATHGS